MGPKTGTSLMPDLPWDAFYLFWLRTQPQMAQPILNLEVFGLFFKIKVSTVQFSVLSVGSADCYNTGTYRLCLSFTDWGKTIHANCGQFCIESEHWNSNCTKMQLFRCWTTWYGQEEKVHSWRTSSATPAIVTSQTPKSLTIFTLTEVPRK